MALDTGTRVYNTGCIARRLLTKQFNTAADVFTKVDPSPAGTPLTLTSATGISGMDGTVTLSFRAGFTPTLTLTFYIWQEDLVAPSKAGWHRAGNAATGSSQSYNATVDSNYATIVIALPNNIPFLVMADKSVTGDVYTDAKAHSSNNNTVSGYDR